MKEAKQVDPELEEKMSQKMSKDFEGHEWYGSALESEKTPLVDPSVGKPIIIRSFEFKMNPQMKRFTFDKQALFNAHAMQIKTLLWGDGLRPYEGESPKVFIDTKNRVYKIVVVAEPRIGMTVIENPTSLNKVLSTARKS